MKKIVIASDHGAVNLKNDILSFLQSQNCEINDLGVKSEEPVDYPDLAAKACAEFKKGNYDFGILLCGTGIGMCIAANKIKGIRCALIHDLFTARMAKEHNDANFIALGGRIKYCVPVTQIIETYMKASFAGNRHSMRVAKIMNLENSTFPEYRNDGSSE